MEYVLRPIPVCEKFTLMEAVYWVAFSLPPIKQDWNKKERYWYEHNDHVYDVFSQPRTYWPDYDVPEKGRKLGQSLLPKWPSSIPVKMCFFLRKRTEPTQSPPEEGSIDPDDLEKLKAYRDKHRQEVEEFKNKSVESDLNIIHQVEKAKVELVNALLTSKVTANATLSGKLKDDCTGENDDDWIDVTNPAFNSIDEGDYQRRFPGSVLVTFEWEPNIGAETPFDEMDESAQPILPKEWLMNGIDWSTCTLKSNGNLYTGIHFDKNNLLSAFPSSSGQAIPGKIRGGIIYLENAIDEIINFKKRPGAPRQYEDDFIAREVISLIAAGQTKQTAITSAVCESYFKKHGVDVPVNTMKDKVSSIYKANKKTSNIK